LLDIGNIPIGGDLGVAYSEQFHAADPNRDAIFSEAAKPEPIVLPTFARRMYSDSYRKLFFDDSGIVDKFATAIWVESACFYVNFYRIKSQGRFAPEEIERLKKVAPAVSAAVARHFQDQPASELDPGHRLAQLLASNPPFDGLTGRERDVCRRILVGFSSEA